MWLYSSSPRFNRITSVDLPPDGGPSSSSSRRPTSDPAAAARIWMARQPPVDAEQLGRQLKRIERFVLRGQALDAMELLSSAVPEFVVSPEAWTAATLQTRPGVARVRAPQTRSA